MPQLATPSPRVQYAYSDPLMPVEAEEASIAAFLADGDALRRLQQRARISEAHYYDPRTRMLAEALFRIIDPHNYDQPRPIDRATVVTELRQLGYWEREGGISNDDLRRLDRAGTLPLVESVDQYVDTVITAANGRAAVDEAIVFAEEVMRNPAGLRGLHTNLVDQTGRIVSRVDRGVDYSIAAINQRHELQMVRGIYTGVPLLDVVLMGLNEAEIIGVQASQKGGKTRFWTASLLRVLRSRVPTVVFTTDDTEEMFRNRLVSLIGTAWLSQPVYEDTTDATALDDALDLVQDGLPAGARAPVARPRQRGRPIAPHRAPREEWHLSPRRLDLSSKSRLSRIQKQACEYGLTVLNDELGKSLFVLDTSAGIQEFTVLEDELHRHMRAPFNCQLWAIDHAADLFFRGQQDFAGFKHIITRLKTLNNAWRTTGVLVNQRNEGGNKERGKGGSLGSYMGGTFGASVHHLIEINDGLTDEYIAKLREQPGWEQITRGELMLMNIRISRWGEPIQWTWIVDPDSGFILNPRSYPRHLAPLVDELPYIHNPDDPASWRH